jgi:hypothetical protein
MQESVNGGMCPALTRPTIVLPAQNSEVRDKRR